MCVRASSFERSRLRDRDAFIPYVKKINIMNLILLIEYNSELMKIVTTWVSDEDPPTAHVFYFSWNYFEKEVRVNYILKFFLCYFILRFRVLITPFLLLSVMFKQVFLFLPPGCVFTSFIASPVISQVRLMLLKDKNVVTVPYSRWMCSMNMPWIQKPWKQNGNSYLIRFKVPI